MLPSMVLLGAAMGRISMATRHELLAALVGRYAASSREQRGRILDEFTAVSGLHRKHAMRLLRAGRPEGRTGARPERRLYKEAVREALIVLWEASDRVCGKRFRALVPILVEAMERHGHLQLAPDVRAGLLRMSAATMDRALGEARGAGGKRRHAPPSIAIRRSIPVRTFDGWDDPAPGFVEADLVAHSGPVTKGSFVQTPTRRPAPLARDQPPPIPLPPPPPHQPLDLADPNAHSRTEASPWLSRPSTHWRTTNARSRSASLVETTPSDIHTSNPPQKGTF